MKKWQGGLKELCIFFVNLRPPQISFLRDEIKNYGDGGYNYLSKGS